MVTVAPQPAQAFDPATAQEVLLATCRFRVSSDWSPQSGQFNDVYAAGIVEQTGPSWVAGVAYSGFSVVGSNVATEMTQATLDLCATATNRLVDIDDEILGDESHAVARVFGPTVDQIRSNGDVSRFVFRISDPTRPQVVPIGPAFDGPLPVDYDADPVVWGSTTTIGTDQFYRGAHPVAHAGPDITGDPGDLATIDAAGSGDRGRDGGGPGQAVSVTWTQTGGPSVTLDEMDPLRRSFIAPAFHSGVAEVLTFPVVPVDDRGNFPHPDFTYRADEDDTVKVTINAVDITPPVVIAPDMTVGDDGGTTGRVTLAATVTDDSGEVLTPVFSLTSGGAAIPAAFDAPLGATTLYARATDSAGNTGESSFLVTVNDATPPVITAPAVVATANPVSLAASVADNSGETITPVYEVLVNNGFGFTSQSITPLHDFTDGFSTVRVTATDSAGNASFALFNVSLDLGGTCPNPLSLPVINENYDYCDFSNTFSAFSFVDSSLRGANFAQSNFELSTIVDTVFAGANFSGVIMRGATVEGSDFSGAYFVGANLSGSDFENSSLAGADLTFANVTDTNFLATALTGLTFRATVGITWTTAPDQTVTLGPSGSTVQVSYAATARLGGDGDLSSYIAFDPPSGSAFPLGDTQVTQRLIDASGNIERTHTFTVTVFADVSSPVITAPDIAASADAGAAFGTVTLAATVADDFDTGLVPVFSLTPDGATLPANYAAPIGVTTIHVRATDTAGNVGRATFDVTITDAEAPVFANVPDFVLATAGSGGTSPVSWTPPTATDNSGAAPIVTSDAQPGDTFPVGPTPVTYTARDAAGNSSTAVFFVYVNPAEAVVVSGPAAPVVLRPGGAAMDYTVTLTNPNAFDAVGVAAGAITGSPSSPTAPVGVSATLGALSGTCGPPDWTLDTVQLAVGGAAQGGTLPAGATCRFTITLTADATAPDDSYRVTGLSSFQTGTGVTFNSIFTDLPPIEVRTLDTQAPAITAPDVATATDTGAATASVALAATVTDNVDTGLSPIFSLSLDGPAITSPASFPLGATQVFVRAEDAAGNIGRATFTVTVTDAEAPVITADNVSVLADTGEATATVPLTAIVADNSGAVLSPIFALTLDGPALTSPAAFPIGVTDVFVRAEDAAGNTGRATFTVTITDAQAPVLTLTDVLTPTDAGAATASVTLQAGVVDNSGETLTPTFALSAGGVALTSPFSFAIGTTTVFVRAQDSAGNAVQDSYLVTVTDEEAPVITAADISLPTNPGQSDAAVTLAASVTDNSGAVLAPVFSLTLDGPALTATARFASGVSQVFVRAVDAAGNTGRAQFTVTVIDAEMPQITASNITVPTDIGVATASVTLEADVADNSGEVLAPVFSLSLNGAPITSPASFALGTTTVFVRAEDSVGNIGQGQFTVTVTDEEPPIVAAASIAANTDAGISTASVGLAASVSDNSGETLTPVFSLTLDGPALASPNAFGIGTTTVFVRAEDSAGNVGRTEFTVTVTDPEVPMITASNVAVPTDAGTATASVTLAATVSDNSGETLTPIFSLSLDGPALSSPHIFDLGDTLVFVRATDAGGNTGRAQFTVTVTDAEAPVIAPVADIAVDVPFGTAQASLPFATTVTDNVPDTILPVFRIGAVQITSPHDFPAGVSVVTVDAEDAAGNLAAQIQFTVTVTVLPNTPPVARAGPDRTLGQGSLVTLDASGSSDADGDTLSFLWTAPVGVTLSSTISATPTFTAPMLAPGDADQTLTFQVAVSDGTATQTDSVTITVRADVGVTLSDLPSTFTAVETLTLSVAFTRPVTGFDAGDLIVTGGSALGISGSGASYTVQIRTTGGGDLSVIVPARVAVDASGLPNAASNSATARNEVVELTRETIATFMEGRANALLSNQPDLAPLLGGGGTGVARMQITPGQLNFAFATDPDHPMWLAVSASWAETDAVTSGYSLATLGYHREVTDDLLVGVMVQLDHARDATQTGWVEGAGWLVGPYIVGRAPAQPLRYEARLLYGQTENRISPTDTYVDTFTTERVLAQMRLTGEIERDWGVLQPHVDFSHVWDSAQTYTDALGNEVLGQQISLSALTLGLDFTIPVTLDAGTGELTGGISGIWSATRGGADPGAAFDGGRARVDLGWRQPIREHSSFEASVFHDGIGADGFASQGFSLDWDWRF